jgi:hypothetical protein
MYQSNCIILRNPKVDYHVQYFITIWIASAPPNARDGRPSLVDCPLVGRPLLLKAVSNFSNFSTCHVIVTMDPLNRRMKKIFLEDKPRWYAALSLKTSMSSTCDIPKPIKQRNWIAVTLFNTVKRNNVYYSEKYSHKNKKSEVLSVPSRKRNVPSRETEQILVTSTLVLCIIRHVPLAMYFWNN